MMESAGLLPYRPYSWVERDDIARGLPCKPLCAAQSHIEAGEANTLLPGKHHV